MNRASLTNTQRYYAYACGARTHIRQHTPCILYKFSALHCSYARSGRETHYCISRSRIVLYKDTIPHHYHPLEQRGTNANATGEKSIFLCQHPPPPPNHPQPPPPPPSHAMKSGELRVCRSIFTTAATLSRRSTRGNSRPCSAVT